MNGITLQAMGKKGNYRALFTVRGERYCRTVGTPIKRVAEKRAMALKKSIEAEAWEAVAGVSSAKGQASVGEWCRAYLQTTNVKLSAAKINARRLKLLYREALGKESVDDVKLSSLTRAVVEQWIAKRQGEPSPCWRTERPANTTINNILRLSKSMFSKESMRRCSEELKTAPPRLGWKDIQRLKEPSHKYRPLDHETIDRIKAASEKERAERPWMWLCTQLMLQMGLRASEVFAAQRQWVETYPGGIVVLVIKSRPGFTPKSHNSCRNLEVPTELIPALTASEDPESPLIESHTFTERHERIYREHSQWLRQFIPGRTKSNHELRKHAGSMVAGLHGIESAAQFLGDSIATTESHYHGLLSLVPALKPADLKGFVPRVIDGKAV